MSLRRNVIASYASQIYVTLIGIIMVPTYIKYMGIEAYGLVGFYAMLQAWFQLLDLGLAATLSRETARYRGGATDAATLSRLLRSLECIFFVVAAVGATALLLNAPWISIHWLQIQHLPTEQVSTTVRLMAGIVALRWVAGLYRGAIGGFEQQAWLAGANSAVATARSVLVVPAFILLGSTPVHFFSYQLAVALLETGTLMWRAYSLMPKLPVQILSNMEWSALRGILRFSLGVAFSNVVWIAVTQSDKLLLSRLLPLSDYAQFTLAILVASGVSVVSGPIGLVLPPRMSRLHAQGSDAALARLYRHATQGMAVIVAPVALTIAFGAQPLLYAWTGDAALAARVAPILQLYTLGNGILAVSAFGYYIQFAKGNIQLHMVGNIFFVALLIPSIWWSTLHHGALGASWAWLGANAIYMLCWMPLVHRAFLPGQHMQWLLQDVGLITATAALTVLPLIQWLSWPENRWATALLLAGVAALATALGALASTVLRGRIFQFLLLLLPGQAFFRSSK